MKNFLKNIKTKFYTVMAGLTAVIITSPVCVYADTLQAADKAQKGITTEITSITKTILPIIVAVIGVCLLVGGQRAREGVKEGAIYKIVGLIFIFGAGAIGATIGGWF